MTKNQPLFYFKQNISYYSLFFQSFLLLFYNELHECFILVCYLTSALMQLCKSIYKLIFRALTVRNNFRYADFLLYMRLFCLTLYFILQYICLRCDVWKHPALVSPPREPTLPNAGVGSPESLFNAFVELTHTHIYGHRHLNVSLTTAMRRSLGFALIEFILLLYIQNFRKREVRNRLIGLLAGVSILIHVSSQIYGGFEIKNVLFPSLWEHIDLRLHANYFYPEKTTLDIIKLFSCRLNKFKLLQWTHILDPFTYFRFSFGLHLTIKPQIGDPLPSFIFATIYLLHLLDLIGALLSIFTVYTLLKPLDLMIPGGVLLVLLAITSTFVSKIPKPNAKDYHWINFQSSSISKNYKLVNYTTPPIRISKYVLMDDSTRIAVDVYLPYNIVHTIVCTFPDPAYKQFYQFKFKLSTCTKERPMQPERLKIPTYLMITRYNRRITVHWPFTMLSFWGQPRGESTVNLWGWQFVDTLVPNDYALVIADTRGTGASFGTRPVDLSALEIFDFVALRKWVTEQMWYDENIAVGGFSYDGMTGVYLAAIKPVQAVLALFTPINVVHDLIQPGGLVCSAFIEDYTGLTHGFETSGTPRGHLIHDLQYDMSLIAGLTLVFGQAAPVKSYEHLFLEALQNHEMNWNMSEMVQSIHFTDDFVVVPKSQSPKVEACEVTHPFLASRIFAKQFGITQHLVDHIASRPVTFNKATGEKTTAPVYIVGGYCDSSSVKGSIRLFDALRRSKTNYSIIQGEHRLTLGPWTHTGRRNCSPFSSGTYSHFELDMYWDILRFLDNKLKNKTWIISDDEKGIAFSVVLSKNSIITSLSESLTNKNVIPKQTKVNDSSPVHFWSVGDEKWFSSEEYPPVKAVEVNYDFSQPLLQNTEKGNNSEFEIFSSWKKKDIEFRNTSAPFVRQQTNWSLFLREENYRKTFHTSQNKENIARSNISHIYYQVDYNATTRGISRWMIAKHAFRMASYSKREMVPSSTSRKSLGVIPQNLTELTAHTKHVQNLIYNAFLLNFKMFMWNFRGFHSQKRITGHFIKQFQIFFQWVFKLFKNCNRILELLGQDKVSTGDLLTFTSPVLENSFRLVGSPLVRFSIDLTEEFYRRIHELKRSSINANSQIKVNQLDPVPALDVTIFAYLEDVDPETNNVHYVTEARILLSHRPTIPNEAMKTITGLESWDGCASWPLSEEFSQKRLTIRQQPRLGSADIVYQKGDRVSHRFTVGGTECVAFTFEPVTWLFKKNHQIRLSLAGADIASFQWSRTQSKEDVDLLAQSLLFAVKVGNHEWLNEIQRRPVRVERPHNWKIPLQNSRHVAFLKLMLFQTNDDFDKSTNVCLVEKNSFLEWNKKLILSVSAAKAYT